MPKVHLHFMMGAGGTGKTTVLDQLLRQEDLLAGKSFHFGSIVREFYSNHGIESETEFFALSESKRLEFQVDLLAFYMKRLELAIANAIAKGCARLISDRSVYDHVAHCLYANPSLTSDAFATTVMGHIWRFAELGGYIYYFPFPPNWDYQIGADGFRQRNWAKDYALDALMTTLAGRHHPRDVIGGETFCMCPSVLKPNARTRKMVELIMRNEAT